MKIARAGWVMGIAIGALLGACRPSSVTDAETKGDVEWLDAEGSPAAIEALGRLADKDPKAVSAVEGRAQFDVTSYIAAWQGVRRGAKWASDLLHAGLQDPSRAEVAASAVEGRDPAIAPFLSDVETSMTRLAAGGMTSTLAAVLASAGAQAHDAITRRLADKATRGAMCGGIAAPQASPESRVILRTVPPESRDADACVGSVSSLAASDDAMLHWLAQQAEPGLLGAASRTQTIDCVRLHRLWVDAIAARASQPATLTVPLSLAVKRCPATMDGVLADALKTHPETQAAIVGALDPFSADDLQLTATCGALTAVVTGRASPIAKERASDTIAHGCKGLR